MLPNKNTFPLTGSVAGQVAALQRVAPDREGAADNMETQFVLNVLEDMPAPSGDVSASHAVQFSSATLDVADALMSGGEQSQKHQMVDMINEIQNVGALSLAVTLLPPGLAGYARQRINLLNKNPNTVQSDLSPSMDM